MIKIKQDKVIILQNPKPKIKFYAGKNSFGHLDYKILKGYVKTITTFFVNDQLGDILNEWKLEMIKSRNLGDNGPFRKIDKFHFIPYEIKVEHHSLRDTKNDDTVDVSLKLYNKYIKYNPPLKRDESAIDILKTPKLVCKISFNLKIALIDLKENEVKK